MVAPGTALGLVMLTPSAVTAEIFVTASDAFAGRGVLVIVQDMTSPNCGVMLAAKLALRVAGSVVDDPVHALVQAIVFVYCARTVVPDAASDNV